MSVRPRWITTLGIVALVLAAACGRGAATDSDVSIPFEKYELDNGLDVILHVDHIVPASRGGTSTRPNLQFLCAEHNLRKSNKREVSGPWLDLL